MVVGNGMIGKRFSSYKNNTKATIFASGVSNSSQVDMKEYNREKELVLREISKAKDSLFVYFSTCAFYDTYNDYGYYKTHKLNMENLIKSNSEKYLIIRLPQVIGVSKSNSLLINYLSNCIKNSIDFSLFDIERNLIDIDDVYYFVNDIIEKKLFQNEIVNIANIENTKVIDIVKIIESIFNKKAEYSIKRMEGNFKIDLSLIQGKNKNYRNIFLGNYIEKIIIKYC